MAMLTRKYALKITRYPGGRYNNEVNPEKLTQGKSSHSSGSFILREVKEVKRDGKETVVLDPLVGPVLLPRFGSFTSASELLHGKLTGEQIMRLVQGEEVIIEAPPIHQPGDPAPLNLYSYMCPVCTSVQHHASPVKKIWCDKCVCFVSTETGKHAFPPGAFMEELLGMISENKDTPPVPVADPKAEPAYARPPGRPINPAKPVAKPNPERKVKLVHNEVKKNPEPPPSFVFKVTDTKGKINPIYFVLIKDARDAARTSGRPRDFKISSVEATPVIKRLITLQKNRGRV